MGLLSGSRRLPRLGGMPLVLLLATLPLPSARAENHALLIGIDDYPHARKLKGAVNDVRAIRDILVNDVKIPEANIEMLLNEQATKAGIVRALRSLGARSRVGDSLFLYYSGHGWLVNDVHGDESAFEPENRFDEALVPYDGVPWPRERALEPNPTLLIDDEIAEAMSNLLGRRLAVVFDSCHAGSGLRSTAGIGDSRSLYEGIALPAPKFKSLTTRKPTLNLNGPVMFLAAASWRETASDLGEFEGRRHGALTAGLLRSIRKIGPNWQAVATWESLFKMVREDLLAQGIASQTPALTAPGSLRKLTVAEFFRPMPATEIAALDSGGSFEVYLEVNRYQFTEGDLLELAIESARDGYLYVFDINSDQQVTQLFPNRFEPDNHLAGASLRRVPAAKDRYQFRAGKPFGQSTIVAVVTVAPWSRHSTLNLPSNLAPVSEFQKTQLRDGLRDLQMSSLEGAPVAGAKQPIEWASQRVTVEVVGKQSVPPAREDAPPPPPPVVASAPQPVSPAAAVAAPAGPTPTGSDDDMNLGPEDQRDLEIRRPALFARLERLAERYSPIFWQDVSGQFDSHFRPWKDFFVRYDFDRTTLGPNWPDPPRFQDEVKRVRNRSLDAWLSPETRNKIEQVAATPGVFRVTDAKTGETMELDLRPTVYWAVLSTSTHYFFHYVCFKAEDWKPLFGHTGDLEGTTVVVDRKTEKMVAALTLAHDDVQVTRGLGDEAESNIEVLADPSLADRGLWDDPGARPINGALAMAATRGSETAPKEHQDIYSETRGHGQYGPHKIHPSRYIIYAAFLPDETWRAPSFERSQYPLTDKFSEVQAKHKYHLVYIGSGEKKVQNPDQKSLWSEYRGLSRFPGGVNPPWCWRDNLFFRTGWWKDPRTVLKIGDGRYRINPYQ